MTAAAAIVDWVTSEERRILRSALWSGPYALTLVRLSPEQVAQLSTIMPRAFKGLEGGAVVVTTWSRAIDVWGPSQWALSAPEDEFVAVYGPHAGRFPHEFAEVFS